MGCQLAGSPQLEGLRASSYCNGVSRHARSAHTQPTGLANLLQASKWNLFQVPQLIGFTCIYIDSLPMLRLV